tara:strand:+ start:892 stop:1461 length:570 start_codon:yes stop_codon:yes gene_type:complete
MPRKCPPGAICIENITLIFLIMIILLIIYLFNRLQKNDNVVVVQQPQHIIRETPRDNVFLNPHTIPSRNNIYDKSLDPRGTPVLPINVRTQGIEQQFRQVGILTRSSGETILPLMGRSLLANRGKFQFYTMNDKNHMIKLPISKNGRSCTGEYGCDDLMNGDTVFVEGYKDTFSVTIYESNLPRYIPFI